MTIQLIEHADLQNLAKLNGAQRALRGHFAHRWMRCQVRGATNWLSEQQTQHARRLYQSALSKLDAGDIGAATVTMRNAEDAIEV